MSTCDVTKFFVAEPDDDGDMRLQIEISGLNSSGDDVRLIKSTAVFFSKDGVAFASGSSNDSVVIDPNEDFQVSPGPSWLKVSFAGASRDDIRCEAHVVLYKREFHRLGEVKISKSESDPVILAKTVDSNTIDPDIKIAFVRNTPDEDGDVSIDIRCGIVNLGNSRLDQIALKVEILDEDDSIIQTDETSIDVNSNDFGLIESSIWGINKGLLKSARARCYLTVFHPVMSVKCKGLSTPHNES